MTSAHAACSIGAAAASTELAVPAEPRRRAILKVCPHICLFTSRLDRRSFTPASGKRMPAYRHRQTSPVACKWPVRAGDVECCWSCSLGVIRSSKFGTACFTSPDAGCPSRSRWRAFDGSITRCARCWMRMIGGKKRWLSRFTEPARGIRSFGSRCTIDVMPRPAGRSRTPCSRAPFARSRGAARAARATGG